MNLAAITASDPRESSVRIDVEVCNFVRYVRYVGTKQDLIAEGYATEAMFPDEPIGVMASMTECFPSQEGTVCYRWEVTRAKDGKFDLRTTRTEWTG